jgi:hypothetical protein
MQQLYCRQSMSTEVNAVVQINYLLFQNAQPPQAVLHSSELPAIAAAAALQLPDDEENSLNSSSPVVGVGEDPPNVTVIAGFQLILVTQDQCANCNWFCF